MRIFFFFIAVSIYALGIAFDGVDNLRGLEDGESSAKGPLFAVGGFAMFFTALMVGLFGYRCNT